MNKLSSLDGVHTLQQEGDGLIRVAGRVDPDGLLSLDLSLRGWVSPIESISVQALRLEHWGGGWKRYRQLWQERYSVSRKGDYGPAGIRRLRSRATARRTATHAGTPWVDPRDGSDSDSEATYLSETEYNGVPTDPFTRLQEEQQQAQAVAPAEEEEALARKERVRGRNRGSGGEDPDDEDEDDEDDADDSEVSDDEADLRYIEKHGITSEVVLWESLVFSQVGGAGDAELDEDREQAIPIPWRRSKALSGDLDLQLQLHCEGIPGIQPTAIFFPPDVATTPSVAAQAAVPTNAPEEYWDFSQMPDWLDDYALALRGAELLPRGPRAGPARRRRRTEDLVEADYGATSPMVAPTDASEGPPRSWGAPSTTSGQWVTQNESAGDSDDEAGVWDVERSTPRGGESPFVAQELPPVRAPTARPALSNLQRIRAAGARTRADVPSRGHDAGDAVPPAREEPEGAPPGDDEFGDPAERGLVPSPYSVRTVLRVLVTTKHTSPLGRKETFRRYLWAERELCVVRTRQPRRETEGDLDGASTPVMAPAAAAGAGAGGAPRVRRTGSGGSASFVLGEVDVGDATPPVPQHLVTPVSESGQATPRQHFPPSGAGTPV